ncbi:hypothetical protein RSAG8_07514, partial [Rhizoctonia solani AG-8 WAC10335]
MTVTSWIAESTDVNPGPPQSEWTFSTSTRPRTHLPTVTATTATTATTAATAATASSRSNLPISTSAPTVVPTYSGITNSLGSVVSTLSYDATVSPAPITTSAPDSQYVITSWTTWMTVNGSTVPAIAGEVGILSTIPITYMLEPSTTIPVAELSSRSIESARTSSPSPTTAASSDNSQTRQNHGGKIAGAVVGTLVGWTGPSREAETSSNEGAASWFQPESSDTHHVPPAVATRAGKPATRNEPTLRPDMITQRPAPSLYRAPSLANPSLSLLPTPFQNEPPSPVTPPSRPSRAALMPSRVSPPPRVGPSQSRYINDEEQIRHNAIPPLYNEAWNTGR